MAPAPLTEAAMAVHDTGHEPMFPQRELRNIPAPFLIALFAVLIFVVFFVVAN